MPKKKTRKKSYPSKRLLNPKGLVFAGALLVSLFIAVAYLQQQQTIRQYATTDSSEVAVPPWGCVIVGGSNQNCTTTGTFFSDPTGSGSAEANCLVLESAGIEPQTVTKGEKLTGTILIRNTCFKGVQPPVLFLKALHTDGSIIEFPEKSEFPILAKDQSSKFSTEYTVKPEDSPGEWKAVFLVHNLANEEIPFNDESSNIPFTIKEPCPGLEVSKAITVDKGYVGFGESILGSITYKNPCTIDYTVKNILIMVQKPGPPNTITTDDFIPSLGQITIAAGQGKVVEGSLTIPQNACGEQPTCEWKAYGAYETMPPEDEWRADTTLAGFTIGAPIASASGDPSASTSGVPSEPAPTNAPPAEPPPPLPAKVVYFLFDKSDIRPEYFPALDDTTAYLVANPTARIQVIGHTDNVGSDAYNQGLSERRANAVKNYIVGKGIAADRIDASGRGETQPVAPNTTPEGRDKNRRADITSL